MNARTVVRQPGKTVYLQSRFHTRKVAEDGDSGPANRTVLRAVRHPQIPIRPDIIPSPPPGAGDTERRSAIPSVTLAIPPRSALRAPPLVTTIRPGRVADAAFLA